MAEPGEIACENCVAACCKAPKLMQLTQKEYGRHSPKMDLRVIKNPLVYSQRVEVPEAVDEPIHVQAGYGLYLLASGCANLTATNRCSVYEERPGCCSSFELGSAACLRLRRNAGLDADRPRTEDESASGPAPDPTQLLVQQFFPAARDEQERGAPTPSPRAPEAAFDLGRLRTSVSRDARWIGEQLPTCESWSRRTRLPGWSVGDLAAHLVTGLRLADAVLRAAIERRGAKSPLDFEGDRAATVRAFNAVADTVVASLDRITPAAAEREVVIDDVEAVTAQHLIEVLVMELSVHGLDLAAALGETRHLSSDAVGAIAHVLPDLLDPGVAPPAGTAYVLRSSAFELPLTWHRNVWSRSEGSNPCSVEGDPEAVLLYALGRVPFDKSGLTTNRPDLARAFKRYLGGP